MTQIERIARMEQLLNHLNAALSALADSPEAYRQALPAIRELEAYYTGPQWMQDFDADCAGNIPATLPRGVLSEDAVYNLLCDLEQIKRRHGI